MTLAADFGTGQVFWSFLWFFMFFIWIWLLIIVFSDVFRSHDLSGWAKALWVIFIIVVPYLGVFVYLIARGHKMQEHAVAVRTGARCRGEGVHPAGGCDGQEPGRRAREPRRPQGEGRHRRRRVPAVEGQGSRVTSAAPARRHPCGGRDASMVGFAARRGGLTPATGDPQLLRRSLALATSSPRDASSSTSGMVHDPVVAETVRSAEHLEPRFVLRGAGGRRDASGSPRTAARRQAAERARDPVRRRRLGRLRLLRRRRRGRRADAEHRPARAPTGCCSRRATREPSCTPSRASLMTGRLPMRHGLLRPPMYGEPGGLQGEITLAAAARRRRATSRRPSASGTWARTRSRSRRTSASTTSTASSRVSDMYTEWRDPYFFPEIVYSEERTALGREPAVQQVLRARDDAAASSRTSRRSRSRCSRCSTTSGPTTRSTSSSAWPAASSPGSSTTARAARTSTTTRTSDFLGTSPAKHPYKDTIIELDDIVGRLVADARGDRSARATRSSSSRPTTDPEMETWPDAAYSPFRCAKGSTWEGGQRVPGDRRRGRG